MKTSTVTTDINNLINSQWETIFPEAKMKEILTDAATEQLAFIEDFQNLFRKEKENLLNGRSIVLGEWANLIRSGAFGARIPELLDAIVFSSGPLPQMHPNAYSNRDTDLFAFNMVMNMVDPTTVDLEKCPLEITLKTVKDLLQRGAEVNNKYKY